MSVQASKHRLPESSSHTDFLLFALGLLPAVTSCEMQLLQPSVLTPDFNFVRTEDDLSYFLKLISCQGSAQGRKGESLVRQGLFEEEFSGSQAFSLLALDLSR